ncbi:helix-turn-helix domain-containing protein [Peribacillus simplex]|uniref:helix-turn-helix domain-containing protein n=1 Tax=Peribacillus simplex TaxID=1478 RepID=UPI0024BF59F4|nr:XRE family transcriptional regulator [Peribacillus simplex]WHY95419.1 XRE family transcriptional regulator [Peribacillus simplex]
MDEVHEKIKNLRMDSKLTLKELSEKTELSSSFLSMIERGSSSLTITSLKKIADAFEVDISYFFDKPINNTKFYVKKSEQKKFRIEGSETSYIRLSGNFSNRTLEPLVVVLQPNQQKDYDYSHAGEEFYYVLKGLVRFKVDGEEFDVTEGESIHFPSQIPHDYENPLEEESILLCVLTPILF